ARGGRGAAGDAAGDPAPARRRRPGRDARRRGARLHERPLERGRERVPLGHLRLPRHERRLADRGGARGGASRRRGLDGGGLVGVRARVVAAALAGALSLAAAAAADGASAPPPLAARAYVLVSGVDGATLAARAAREPRPIASITKLMTVLVARDQRRLDDVVAVPEAATEVGESSVDLRAGERLTVRELVLATLVPSANDAATALAYAASGGSLPRFVAWMNERARALGLADTRFVNPHGLDAPGHVS